MQEEEQNERAKRSAHISDTKYVDEQVDAQKELKDKVAVALKKAK